MSYTNYADAMAQITSAGIMIDKPLNLDARIQRWKVDGEDRERRGWTRLKEWRSSVGVTYIVGVYGIWHGNDDGMVKIDLPTKSTPDRPPLTAEDIAAIRAAQKESQRKIAEERKREAKQASRWAAAAWSGCVAAPADHEYLVRKQIQPHGLRVMVDTEGMLLTGLDESNFYRLKMATGALVVPMHDEQGVVCGIQFIYPKGHERAKKLQRDKEFWPSGMAMGGTFGMIGPIKRGGIMLIGEGFATMASLYEATGQTVVYAFSANNLVKAGKLIRKSCPGAHLLFCADDDYLTDGNPGVIAASNATAEIERSAWIKPDFAGEDGADLRNGKKLTDFNDLRILTGLTLPLANQINAKLVELKWKDGDVPPRVDDETGGQGNRNPLKSMLAIDEAIKRFSLVYGGKGTLFDHDEHMLVPKADVLDILPEHGWRDMRAHKRVARLDEVGFDPAGTDERITCNLWGGWPTVPKSGHCDLLLELLQYLCSGEEKSHDVYQWALKWLAYPIQHPGAKMRTALIFHGPQGTGKNLFFESIMALYGEYGRIVDQSAIEDKFNDWASRKLLLIADEVVARNELYHVKNKLKTFVTGEWIRINPKNVAAHDERNHVNLIFLSNENQPLALERDDRRYLVIHTPSKLDAEFYQDARREIDAGGIAALHHYLLNLDLEDFDEHTKPPMTRAKEDLIDVGMDSVSSFLHEWQQGEIEDIPFCPCLGTHLYGKYRKYCELRGERSPRSAKQFIGVIKLKEGWKAGEPISSFKSLSSTDRISRKMIIPPDKLLVDACKWQKNYTKADETPQVRWITDCFFSFADAAGWTTQ
jgi:putative DNA primase/helicase